MSMETHCRPRVGLFIPNFAGGGAERMALAAAESLARLGYQTHVYAHEKQGPLFHGMAHKLGITCFCECKYRRSRLPYYALRTLKAMASCDVVVGANEGRATALAFLAAKMTGRPIIGWLHVSWPEFGRQASWRQRAALRLYRFMDAVVGCSAGVLAAFDTLVPLVSCRKHIIRNGIDVAQIRSDSCCELHEDHRELFGSQTFLSVGRLAPQKDPLALLEAFAIVHRGWPDSRLVFIGVGPLESRMRARVGELALTARVSLLGFEASPHRYMAKAVALVLSSRFEGYPLVLVEAIACGTPVIAFDCPHGPRKIIGESRAGVLVPPGDIQRLAEAMKAALTGIEDWEARREDALERAKLFSIDKMAQQWARVIDEAVLART